jgi:hypothetical protein
MKWENAVDEMLEKAGPSIRYRIRRDILGERLPDAADRLLKEILEDPHVKYALSLQKPDGYFGDVFHAGFIPKGPRIDKSGVEGIMGFLFEKGLEASDPRVASGLRALERPGWLGQEKGIWCVYYKDIGLYGPEFIKTALLSMFGAAGEADSEQCVRETVDTFTELRRYDSYDSITEDMRCNGKLYTVYKKGVRFPEYYHLKLLAFNDVWKKTDRNAVAEGIRKLVSFSPLRDVRVRHKSRWLAPGGIRPRDLRVRLCNLRTEGWDGDNWVHWFKFFEYFARVGVVKDIPEFHDQAMQLCGLLDDGKGFFPIALKEKDCSLFGPSLGLALENSWRDGRMKYDLTFRSLLILHFSDML